MGGRKTSTQLKYLIPSALFRLIQSSVRRLIQLGIRSPRRGQCNADTAPGAHASPAVLQCGHAADDGFCIPAHICPVANNEQYDELISADPAHACARGRSIPQQIRH